MATGFASFVFLGRQRPARPVDRARDGPGAATAARHRAATTAAEIAGAVRYLCSDEAGAFNGVRLPLLGRG